MYKEVSFKYLNYHFKYIKQNWMGLPEKADKSTLLSITGWWNLPSLPQKMKYQRWKQNIALYVFVH